ncbi:MAG TPA: hypothetical protein VF507_00320, partial [Pyrinomonadaceae bacterium]
YILGKKYFDPAPLDLCRTLRELDPSAPIIFYSGDTYESSRRAALDAGAVGYVLEPNLDELIEEVKRLLA